MRVLLLCCLLTACTTPVVQVPVPVACQPPDLGPTPIETRLSVPKDKHAEVIRAGAADLQAWRADALACRAVVEGLQRP